MILYVDATMPGSQNDQYVYSQSAAYMMAEQGHMHHYALLGDSG